MANTRSPAIMGKVAILVLGLVVLGIGLHSHFQSTWAKTYRLDFFPGRPTTKVYDICKGDFKKYIEFLLEGAQQKATCPSPALEHYFVSIIIICFILSLVSLALSLKMDAGTIKLPDAGFHVLAAILVLIAGILYIVSAEQINKLFNTLGVSTNDSAGQSLNWRRGEKIAAGALTILWGLLYGAVAALTFKS